MSDEGVEKREHSRTVGGNANWCSHYGEQYGGSSKKLKTELSCDPIILLLGIYKKEMKTGSGSGICTPMFTTALAMKAKIWKQPKCPSMDEWIKKMRYVWSLCSATREAAMVRGPRTAMKSGPRLPQLEKALAQKRRLNSHK